MDYYTEFKPGVTDEVRDKAFRRDSLRRQRDSIQKKITDRTAYHERAGQQVVKLEGLAGQALIDGQNSYASYQVSLRKRSQEVRDVEQEIEALKRALEQTKRELAIAQRALTDRLNAACQQRRHVVEKEIAELLDKVVVACDSWALDWERLFRDFDTSFSWGKPENFPSTKHPRATLEISAMPMKQRAELTKKKPEKVLTTSA